MKHICPKYRVQLVKESSSLYEYENTITKPKYIEDLARNVLELDKECEEVLVAVALNTKHKVLGTFEVSRGTISSSIAVPREVFKRLCLLNASCFIVVHNHPSGDVEPSSSDIIFSRKLKECGEIMGISLLDSCIIGDGFLSLRERGCFDLED